MDVLFTFSGAPKLQCSFPPLAGFFYRTLHESYNNDFKYEQVCCMTSRCRSFGVGSS